MKRKIGNQIDEKETFCRTAEEQVALSNLYERLGISPETTDTYRIKALENELGGKRVYHSFCLTELTEQEASYSKRVQLEDEYLLREGKFRNF